MRFGKKRKLSSRYIGPFEILERVGILAYRLALPPKLFGVHDVSHVSMLWKYMHDPSHVIEYESLEVYENLTYEEKPVEILDRKEQVLRNREIPIAKDWTVLGACVARSGLALVRRGPLVKPSLKLVKH
ncbi:hypothetical protein FNV43_RR07373 [Rhamnella rubrinervis]|uniref:Tf2-1-like SH3-like domain-containing protein n=1 Tax=Rhamnella rubrinervis TaxID=2594499 RepID=A0A8K0HFQ8_9ROSA|nr:hypothetical protein FNV43_RR07373 [Rhamnella rubrinervis]